MNENTLLPDVLQSINQSCHLVRNFRALIKNKEVAFEQVCAIKHSLNSDCVEPSICKYVHHNTDNLCLKEKFWMEAVFPANRVIYKNNPQCSKEKEIESAAAFRLIWFFQKESKVGIIRKNIKRCNYQNMYVS